MLKPRNVLAILLDGLFVPIMLLIAIRVNSEGIRRIPIWGSKLSRTIGLWWMGDWAATYKLDLADIASAAFMIMVSIFLVKGMKQFLDPEPFQSSLDKFANIPVGVEGRAHWFVRMVALPMLIVDLFLFFRGMLGNGWGSGSMLHLDAFMLTLFYGCLIVGLPFLHVYWWRK